MENESVRIVLSEADRQCLWNGLNPASRAQQQQRQGDVQNKDELNEWC